MSSLINKVTVISSKGKDLSLLLLRVILAYGFYEPMVMKWSNIHVVADWFEKDLGIPFPLLNAYLAATTELMGVILLSIGLGVRFISFPMIIIMLVAIKTVHWNNGFSSADNGYEIPLYYILMLLVLLTHGSGKYGFDYFICLKSESKE